jgi:hypothetical protein
MKEHLADRLSNKLGNAFKVYLVILAIALGLYASVKISLK